MLALLIYLVLSQLLLVRWIIPIDFPFLMCHKIVSENTKVFSALCRNLHHGTVQYNMRLRIVQHNFYQLLLLMTGAFEIIS